MNLCEYCGSNLSARATICNTCSHVQSNSAMAHNTYSAVNFSDLETATAMSTTGNSTSSWNPTSDLRNSDIYRPDVIPLLNGAEASNLDEEEIRYRTVLLDMGLTLTGNLAGEGQLLAGNASMIQNMPESLPEMPRTGSLNERFDQPLQTYAAQCAFQQQPLPPPTTARVPHINTASVQPRYPYDPSRKRFYQQRPPYAQRLQSPHRQVKGTIPLWLVAALIIPILMILIIFSIGRALLRPSHTFIGSAGVVQSGTTATPFPSVTAVPAGNATPMPTNTPLPTPSATDTPSPTPSPSATTTTGLGCINPPSMTLGPVSEGYNVTTSQMVTLCTTGSGKVNWTASWDQNSASWLALDATSGQIKAPGQGQLNIDANASNMKPGNYFATVTFTSEPGAKKLLLHVNFVVQIGCITASPNTLTFTGIAGRSDPTPQQATINNCGATGTWSASIFTTNGKYWLAVNATEGTLNGEATSHLTISASNLNAKLQSGTYSGKILLSIGSSTFTISVTLIVLPSAPNN